MPRVLLAAAGLAFAAALLVVSVAAAHPLGNTTVNAYDRISVGDGSIVIRYVLDVAEIPTAEERRFADTNHDGTIDATESTAYLDGFWGYLQPKLDLSVDQEPLNLVRTNQELTFPPGQGGLSLLRVVMDLRASYPVGTGVMTGSFNEVSFEGIPGWHETIVQAGAGVRLLTSSVPDHDLTNELTSYPPGMVTDPLVTRGASFTYEMDPTAVPSATPLPSPAPAGAAPPSGRPVDPLAALIDGDMSGAGIVLAIGIAMALGAAHAVSPGHGKTLVGAYLLGSRASWGHAIGLGVTMAVTHTAGVFVLGVVVYAATELMIPQRAVGLLSVGSGLLVFLLGAFLVWRSRPRRSIADERAAGQAAESAAGQAAEHAHGHRHKRGDHDHDHGAGGPATALSPNLRRRDVAILGMVGGLVPSGSAVLLLLSSIALQRVALGVVLIVAFGAGMALVLVAIAAGIVGARRRLASVRPRTDPRLATVLRYLPIASAALVMVVGTLLTFQAANSL